MAQAPLAAMILRLAQEELAIHPYLPVLACPSDSIIIVARTKPEPPLIWQVAHLYNRLPADIGVAASGCQKATCLDLAATRLGAPLE